MATTKIGSAGITFPDGVQSSITGGKSLGTNGYYVLPNGLIMQWGTYTGTTGGGTATFPIAFGTCLNAYAINTNGRGTCEGVRFTNSNITVGFGGSNDYGPTCTTFRWMAIGY